MIELINVSKYYPTEFGRHYVFRDVSLQLPLDKSVGVLGPNGAGKSTFLRLLGGADIPTEGKIIKTGLISPPMGLTPGLQSSLTAAENARFAGRIYGLSRSEISDMIEHVRELANIGKFFDLAVGTYSAGMKQRVSFAINMSIDFDYYLFDEIGAGGDREFRKTAKAMVQQRIKTSKFIIASHRVDELIDICDSGIVIQNGELTFFDEIKDALEVYGEVEDDEDDKPARAARRRRQKTALDSTAEESETREARIERLRARREQLRKAREAERGTSASLVDDGEAAAAAPDAAPGEVAAPASTELVASRKARLERLRARREQLRKAREAERRTPASAMDDGEATAAAPVAASGDTAAQASTGPAESGEIRLERRHATRKQRRQERLQARQAAASSVVEPAEIAEAPEKVADSSESVPDRASRTRARRKQATKGRLQRRRAKANGKDGGQTADDTAPSVDEATPTVVIPASTPPEGADVRNRGARRRDAESPATGSRRERAARRREARGRRTDGDSPPTELTPAETEDNLALQRAPLHQQRAQVKSARAIRLLLQHLEGQTASDGSPPAKARAALIAAAQENAASEAAQARAGLENCGTAGHGNAASPPPSTPARRDDARPSNTDN